MAEPIFSREDLNAKIHDGFVVYKNELYLCHVEMGRQDNLVKIYPVNNTKEVFVVDYTSDDFDYRPFKLGYMNTVSKQGTHRSYFLTRSPRRERRASNGHRNILVNGDYSTLQFFLSQSFVDLFKGNYPTFAEAVTAKRTTGSTAFSRDYMFNHESNTIWCGERGEIGVVKKGKILLHTQLGENIHRKILMKSGAQFYD